MMRMGLIVVGLSTLTVMELGTPSHTKTNAPDPFEQPTIGFSASSDTLATADRIEIHHLRGEAPLHPEPTPPPDATALVPGDSNTVDFGATDKTDTVRQQKPRPKSPDPDQLRPKRTSSNKASKIERSKTIVEVKPCRPKAFDSLLQALNLSSRCQT